MRTPAGSGRVLVALVVAFAAGAVVGGVGVARLADADQRTFFSGTVSEVAAGTVAVQLDDWEKGADPTLRGTLVYDPDDSGEPATLDAGDIISGWTADGVVHVESAVDGSPDMAEK